MSLRVKDAIAQSRAGARDLAERRSYRRNAATPVAARCGVPLAGQAGARWASQGPRSRLMPIPHPSSLAEIHSRMRAARELGGSLPTLHPALGAGRLEVFASVTKFTQKSWTHSVSTGEIPEEELARRWELTFGKKSGKKEAAEPAAKEGAKTAKKKRAP